MDKNVDGVGDEEEDSVRVYGFQRSDNRAKDFEVPADEIDTRFP